MSSRESGRREALTELYGIQGGNIATQRLEDEDGNLVAHVSKEPRASASLPQRWSRNRLISQTKRIRKHTQKPPITESVSRDEHHERMSREG
jgi:hypothetical protein